MLLLRSPWSNSSGPWTNSTQHGDAPQTGPASRQPMQEDVDEGERAEQRVPEAEAELVVRKQAQPNRRGDDPELQRRLFEEGRSLVRDCSWARASRRSRGCDRRRRSRSPRRLECRRCRDRRTAAGRRARGREPARAGCSSFLDASDERPDPRDVHLLDRDRLEFGLREERGQVEIRLEADVHGERRDRALDRGQRAGSRCGNGSG